MYKIIGADLKEYGPVTADQIGAWIREGRVGPQTSLQAEGTTDWRAAATFPEFAAALAAQAAAGGGGTPRMESFTGVPPAVLSRDYDLDIGSCISRSWALISKNFWPVVGISFVVFLILIIISQLFSLISGPALQDLIFRHRTSPGAVVLMVLTSVLNQLAASVLIGGLMKYFLKLIRGEPAGIGDAFYGLASAFVPLVLLGLVSGFLIRIGYCLCIVPGVFLMVAWTFAVPLVVDRRMGFWEAMEASRKMVCKHWFVVFGLLIVTGLISLAGLLACCIGAFVTAPIAMVAMMYAYEDIFSPKTA